MINAQKWIFSVPSIEFLGHQIDKTDITPLSSKIEAIKNFPVPTSLRQLRRFVGIFNYYRCFFLKCSYILAELTDIFKSKDKDINFNEKALEAFNIVKQSIANYTKLAVIPLQNWFVNLCLTPALMLYYSNRPKVMSYLFPFSLWNEKIPKRDIIFLDVNFWLFIFPSDIHFLGEITSLTNPWIITIVHRNK